MIVRIINQYEQQFKKRPLINNLPITVMLIFLYFKVIGFLTQGWDLDCSLHLLLNISRMLKIRNLEKSAPGQEKGATSASLIFFYFCILFDFFFSFKSWHMLIYSSGGFTELNGTRFSTDNLSSSAFASHLIYKNHTHTHTLRVYYLILTIISNYFLRKHLFIVVHDLMTLQLCGIGFPPHR